ncbi:sigma-70 family RNA polymerase sigma factor [Chitinophaga rhizosphaerae]|uniref:sigma-70 family RNA polymerase sigma factor n=1 Tax=Chitinophaga rhizosphaerae TaxID=1864947 RepID=UPI0013DF9CE6|nr:sigma-70 family RNA polymerase sigma factor [Chitinophaga rhizosphaerae]
MPQELPNNEGSALLLRIADGDEQAFSSFFFAWAPQLSAIAMKILKNEYARQEVVQEVFIKVWLHRDKLGAVENMGAWLRKITVNQSLLALQRHVAEDKRLEVIQLWRDSQENASHLELKEIQRLVNQAINSLSPQRKTIYRMNRVEGKTTLQIAGELQLSHGYVRNALSAALAVIRERLTESGWLLLIFSLSL